MTSVTLTWHTMGDDRVCEICRALEGYQWIFEVGATAFGNQLTHPKFGVVWDTMSGSNAHGHGKFTCRCHVTPEWQFDDLVKNVLEIYATVKEMHEAKMLKGVGK